MNYLEKFSDLIELNARKICSSISLENISLSTFSDKNLPKRIATSEHFSLDKFEYNLGDFKINLTKDTLLISYKELPVKRFGNPIATSIFNQLTPLVQKERENYNKHIVNSFSPSIDLGEDDIYSYILY